MRACTLRLVLVSISFSLAEKVARLLSIDHRSKIKQNKRELVLFTTIVSIAKNTLSSIRNKRDQQSFDSKSPRPTEVSPEEEGWLIAQRLHPAGLRFMAGQTQTLETDSL